MDLGDTLASHRNVISLLILHWPGGYHGEIRPIFDLALAKFSEKGGFNELPMSREWHHFRGNIHSPVSREYLDLENALLRMKMED
jgi:hypothetical protein